MYTVPKLDDYSPEALDRACWPTSTRRWMKKPRSTTNSRHWKNFRDRWLARKNGILTQVNDIWLKAAPA